MIKHLKTIFSGLIFLTLTTVAANAQSMSSFIPTIVPAKASIIHVTGTNTATITAVPYPRQLYYGHVTYTASATVGNRYIQMNLVDPSSVSVGDWPTSAAITAVLANYQIDFVPGTYRETSFDATHSIQTPYPVVLIIPANYTVKFFDVNNISASDSIDVYVETAPTQ